MDQVSAGDTSRNGVGVRRRRMRARARGLRPASPATPAQPDVFLTPQWLERSFVLPLTEPGTSPVPETPFGAEMADVPSQSVPHHDDFEPAHAAATETGPAPDVRSRRAPDLGAVADPGPDPEPAFVLPPSPEIDFARVIRRADLSRSAVRTIMLASGLSGLLLIAFLVAGSQVVLGMAIAFLLVALTAVVVRVRIATASIPYLDR